MKRTQSGHVAKMAEMQGKKTLLQSPDGSNRPLWVQVLEAVFCLAFGVLGIWLMMIIGVRAGL